MSCTFVCSCALVRSRLDWSLNNREYKSRVFKCLRSNRNHVSSELPKELTKISNSARDVSTDVLLDGFFVAFVVAGVVSVRQVFPLVFRRVEKAELFGHLPDGLCRDVDPASVDPAGWRDINVGVNERANPGLGDEALTGGQ